MIVSNNFTVDSSQGFFVPNVVLDNLIDESCPTYLSVLVFAMYQAQKGNLAVSNQYIADRLKINIMDVVNAFLFYSSKGIIRIHNFKSIDDTEFDVEFLNPTETKNTVEYKPSYRTEEISRNLDNNPRLSSMYKMVAQLLSKNLSTADIELLYSFYDFYALPVEVIIVLVEYFVSKGKRSLKAMEKEVIKWASSGVDTVVKAKSYIKKREDFLSYAYKVRSLVGISNRKLSAKELEFINIWQSSYKSTEDDVKKAFNISVDRTGKLSFAYMDAVLKSFAIEKKGKITQKKEPKKASRYDFEQIEKSAFDNISKKSAEVI